MLGEFHARNPPDAGKFSMLGGLRFTKTMQATVAKHMGGLLLLAVLQLIAVLSAPAQGRTIDVSQYAHSAWTTQEGYFGTGVSVIHSVTQSADGYIWVPGANSLLRFDGVRFVDWKPRGKETLPRRPLRRVLATRDGGLWIAGGGVGEVKANGEYRRFHEADNIDVEWMIEDRDGGVWVSGAGAGERGSTVMCHFSHEKSECFPSTSQFGRWPSSFYEDDKGRLLLCTSTGIWRLRPGPVERLSSFLNDRVMAMGQDPDGTLIYTGHNDTLRMLTEDGKDLPYPLDIQHPSALMRDRDGSLWIGTEGQGIAHLHDGQVDRFTTSDGLTANNVLGLFEDREGNVWAGTTRGLDKFTRPAIVTMTSRQGFATDQMTSVIRDRAGVVWAGTESGLYSLHDGKAVRSKAKLPNEIIHSLLLTSSGRLLVSTYDPDGLRWVDGDTATRLSLPDHYNIFQLSEGKDGDIWLESGNQGVRHLNAHGKPFEDFKPRQVGGISLSYDPKRDGVWGGFSSGGVNFFKDGKRLEKNATAEGRGVAQVHDVQVDADGSVWAAARTGLAHVLNGKLSLLNRKNGLPCDAVNWMRHGLDGNIWLDTECGLVAVKETELATWVANPARTVAISHVLDNTAGVESVADPGWYHPQATVAADGRIYFATSSGLSVLDPRNLHTNRMVPPVHVEEITGDDRPISDTGALQAGVHTLRIAFTALSFVAPRKVLFRYKLEGFDKGWSEPTTERHATYTNLAPGHYTFRVMASNNDGVWNTAGDTRGVYIPPFFYQTIWFRCLVLAVVAAVLWGLYRLRLRRVAGEISARLGERLGERERIARELHDTLLQDVQAVSLQLQVAVVQMTSDDPARTTVDTCVSYMAKAITDGRHHILDIRADTRIGEGLSEALSEYGAQLAQLWPLSFELTTVGTPYDLGPIISDEICKIGRESIGNAFKHSKGKHVMVDLIYQARVFLMTIKDDGIGIDLDELQSCVPNHWGLGNMQDRAEKIGAKLTFASKSQQGTTVTLQYVLPRSAWWFRRKPSKNTAE